ncbi:baculoviral IAP repeat-containing protein 6-like [Watersipora subatra]|uniref:baculoviral IAP repeat-containing protein 6-like n=1 Tax=Watersipora subatra TaxID=2589382 RepID=UPI00355C6926
MTEFCLGEMQQNNQTPMHSRAAINMSWSSVPAVLNFFSQCAAANPMLKEWMAGSDGRLFWAVLLELFSKGNNSGEQQSKEPAVILFFKTVIVNHTTNQMAFSDVICNLLRTLAAMPNSVGGSSLSSFMKNLLLKTILEDEKVYVTVTSHGVNYRFDNNGCLSCCSQLGIGAGHSSRTLLMSVYSTMEQISEEVSKPVKKKRGIKRLATGFRKPCMEMTSPSFYTPADVPIDDMSAGLFSFGEPVKENIPATDVSKVKDTSCKFQFVNTLFSATPLANTVTVGEVLASFVERGLPAGSWSIDLQLYTGPSGTTAHTLSTQIGSSLQVFTGMGGLTLMAKHLPLIYQEITQSNEASPFSGLYAEDLDVYDQYYEYATEDQYMPLGPLQYETSTMTAEGKHENTKKTATGVTTIPPHSLVAFGLFLRLAGYAEMLIKSRTSAKCLLRLVLGVHDDEEGVSILASSVASMLPTLPFTNLKLLYESSPLTTDDGLMLRRCSMEIGVLQLVLTCLSSLGHHSPRQRASTSSQHDHLTEMAAQMAHQVAGSESKAIPAEPKSTGMDVTADKLYWPKGTGFGTGSAFPSRDFEQLLLKLRDEEENVRCMLDIISAFINPDDNLQVESHKTVLPAELYQRLSDSCLLPAIASYLRNDSVLDMSRHIPLYKSVYKILRALSFSQEFVPLLEETVTESDSSTLASLTASMAKCVAAYQRCPKSTASQTNREKSFAESSEEEDQANSLDELALILANTQKVVSKSVRLSKQRQAVLSPASQSGTSVPLPLSTTETYESIFKELQFDTFKFLETMPGGSVRFLYHHHYEKLVQQDSMLSSGNNTRTRRLALEVVTLNTSLPLSGSSSVFVRCDEERMDVMKVLITGPSDTPYMNGCFEFDVFFPSDYPTSPPLINLQTTGNHKVRFNPNLYNEGSVCLSVLNTWHGRPEEKWNAQISSFLQVLVSIQSLILVAEPYFNEPDYERMRGTTAGEANCRLYDSNIRQATVKFAMLEMLKNPSPCFKEVIEKHFWLKRKEIKEQVEQWVNEQGKKSDQETGEQTKHFKKISHNTALLKKHLQQLVTELQAMKPPDGFSESSIDLDITGSSMEPTAPTPSTFGVEGMMESLTHDISIGSTPSATNSIGGLGPDDTWPVTHNPTFSSFAEMEATDDCILLPETPSVVDPEGFEDFCPLL